MLCDVMLCYASICYVILCSYVMLWYVMLCYVMFRNVMEYKLTFMLSFTYTVLEEFWLIVIYFIIKYCTLNITFTLTSWPRLHLSSKSCKNTSQAWRPIGQELKYNPNMQNVSGDEIKTGAQFEPSQVVENCEAKQTTVECCCPANAQQFVFVSI